jgi:2-dehydropantoate 2-reductase
MDPETLARSGEGDPVAQKEIDDHRLAEANRPGGGEHRPSTGQDMYKGRRTEIDFINGFVVKKGDEVGVPAPTNAILTDIVRRVEIGELKPDPKHITDLRLN